jgi:acetyltransferase
MALTKEYSRFSSFFYPQNIAVIGVSPDPRNLAKNIVANLLAFGYQGEILSVGLRKGVVFGQQIYQSVEEIDRDIHLAVILTPAKAIPEILEQCGRKGIKWVVIESAGFSELGEEEGRPLEKACTDVAEKYGIRFIGPNGIGLMNMENGLSLPFMVVRKGLPCGPVSILAQSGGIAFSYLEFLAEENIGINKFVSMGNKLNVDENDLLGYLIHDEGTSIILIYLEGFTDGRRFVEIAAQSKKPILVHKSNRFKATAQIARSHTAALFADDEVVDRALEQAGCVRVNTMQHAVDFVKILTLPPLKGNRLVVLSRSGGHAVIAADVCAFYGFHLPSFQEDFLNRFESRFRAHVIRPQNPLDLGDLFDLEFYEFIVEEMLKRDDVDGLLLMHGYHPGPEQEPSRFMLKRVEELVEQYGKPVAPVILAEASERDYLKKHLKIPVFTAPEDAIRAFNLSHKWHSRRPSPVVPETIGGVDRKKAGDILRDAEGEENLLLKDAVEFLRSYGFSFPPYGMAHTAEQAVERWHVLNGPVAMKINRPHFSHKTDMGLVKLNLNSEEDIRGAFKEIQTLAKSDDLEVVVQEMVSKGREVILGGKRDELFGPVILFGLGGVFVEVLEDVVWCVAPINLEEARNMIRRLRGQKVLKGIRGEGPYDTEAVEDLLVRLSHLLVDYPEIQEVDINPLMVFGESEGAQALDARVILDWEQGKTTK